MKIQHKLHGEKFVLWFIILASLLGVTQASAPPPQEPEYSLSITIAQAPPLGSKLCVGETFEIRTIVNMISSKNPNFERPFNNVKVSVAYKGWTFTTTTGADGAAYHGFELKPEYEGQLTVTASAEHETGFKAAPITLNYRVAQCGKWKLEVYFHEMYRVMNGAEWFVGAYVYWRDTISIQKDLAQTADHFGVWKVYNRDSVKTPLGVKFNKEDKYLQGDFDILWRTEKYGDRLIWFFETQPVNFPPSGLNWDFSLATPNLSEFQKDFVPQRVPVAYGNGRFLEMNGLDRHLFDTNVTRPMSKTTVLNKVAIFFNSPPAEIYEIFIRWTPLEIK